MSTLPPGPRSATFAPFQYMRDPIGCLLPYARKYGPTFLLPGKDPMVITGDVAAIRTIYSVDPDAVEPFDASQGVFLGESSMILVGGSKHRRLRRLLGPPFAPAKVRGYGPRIQETAARHIAALEVGKTTPMQHLAQKISLDVILRTVFGLDDPARMEALAGLLLGMMSAFSPLLFLFPSLRHEFGGLGPFARLVRRQRELNAAFDELIAEARAAGPRTDVLSLILAARDEDGSPLSDAEVRDQLFLLVVAGHETTAIAISWALYELHRAENAPILERLLAEIDASPGDPTATCALPWLDAVCQEALRRWPLAPCPATRRLLQPLELAGFSLPAGMGVSVGIGVVHFDEAIYPDPFRFDPNRFLERKFSAFEFVPFGGGARRCIGAAMAIDEMKIVVAELLRAWRLRAASGRPASAEVRGANVGPKGGIPLVVAERRSTS